MQTYLYRPPPSQSFDLTDLEEFTEIELDESRAMLTEAHEMASFCYDIVLEFIGLRKGVYNGKR